MTEQCAIVGMKFRPPAQGVLDALPQGFPLVLAREPGNKYDENAIMVLIDARAAFEELDETLVGEKLAGFGATRDDVVARMPFQLGYVPRGDAERLAGAVDAAGVARWRGVLAFSATGLPRVLFEVPRGGGTGHPATTGDET
jgi:HIRAN domain